MPVTVVTVATAALAAVVTVIVVVATAVKLANAVAVRLASAVVLMLAVVHRLAHQLAVAPLLAVPVKVMFLLKLRPTQLLLRPLAPSRPSASWTPALGVPSGY